MLVKIENLKKGDEVIVASGSRIIFIKLIREPTLKWKKDLAGVRVPDNCTWGVNSGKQRYSSLKCQVKMKTMSRSGYAGTIQTWKEYDNSLEDYNDEKYFDLNFRDIWLLEN